MKYIISVLIAMGVLFTSGCKQTQCVKQIDSSMYSNAKLVYNYIDGKSQTKEYKMLAQPDGAWRVRLSKEELNSVKGLKSIDVLLPASYAKKGEDGYFINTLSMMGTYRLDNASYSSNVRNHVAFFGMKNPRATWVTIIKGLPL
ncbi:MAG: hypothetical protein J6B07_05430, partial [Opitutales bacterium]|nr:hypothetical protein [Opitutales bacterium]